MVGVPCSDAGVIAEEDGGAVTGLRNLCDAGVRPETKAGSAAAPSAQPGIERVAQAVAQE
jgi:hypothetical protein